jgi:hypothetical protein
MSALHWTVVLGRFAPPGDFVDQLGFVFKKKRKFAYEAGAPARGTYRLKF